MNRRALLWCAAIALGSLVPYAADMMDADLPIWLRFMLLPLSEGLHYMAVLFHEPGHALCHWLFGEPALPVFDTENGGGITYSAGRSQALTAFIYVLMLLGLALLMHRGKFLAAGTLAVFAALHAALVYTGLDLFVTSVMGHGAEIIAGAIFISLGLSRPDVLKAPAERWVALTTGMNFMGRNALLCTGLISSAAKRREHAMQKGIPGLGDYQHAADVIGTSVQAVAGGMSLFIAACALAAVLYVRNRKR